MNLQNIKGKCSTLNWNAILICLFIVYTLFPNFLFIGIPVISKDGLPWQSIDPSWVQGVLFANTKNVVWGEDFIFTYGPLSYLSTRLIIEDLKWLLIGFVIFLSLNLFGFLYAKLNTKNYFSYGIIFFVLLFLMIPTYLGSGMPIMLFLLLIFWITQSFKEPNHINFIFQSLILTLLFFIKFNTGLVSFVFVVMASIYRFYIHSKFKWWGIIYIGLSFILIIIWGNYLNVSLVNYLKGGINIINGFNDIMYIFDERKTVVIFIAVVSILSVSLIILLDMLKDKKNGHEIIFHLFIFFMASYILFKQGFTRGDDQHIEEFYTYFILLAFIFIIKTEKPIISNNKIPIISIIFIFVFLSLRFTYFSIQ